MTKIADERNSLEIVVFDRHIDVKPMAGKETVSLDVEYSSVEARDEAWNNLLDDSNYPFLVNTGSGTFEISERPAMRNGESSDYCVLVRDAFSTFLHFNFTSMPRLVER